MKEIDVDDVLKQMAHSPVHNYVVPGLTSWMIGSRHEKGCVRMFVSERDQQRDITPHSHRFAFECLVLEGTVKNRLWTPSESGDQFVVSWQEQGRMGGYSVIHGAAPTRFSFHDTVHAPGEWYGMEHDEIHSIFFSQGARVLFFEGPPVTETTRILEPWVDGKRIDTMRVEPWMFQKE